MTATPAQVANDLEAQANYWLGRDKEVSRTCYNAARVIRQRLGGERVDGRTWGGLHRRLLNLELSLRSQSGSQIGKSVSRGLQTLYRLNAQAQP